MFFSHLKVKKGWKLHNIYIGIQKYQKNHFPKKSQNDGNTGLKMVGCDLYIYSTNESNIFAATKRSMV